MNTSRSIIPSALLCLFLLSGFSGCNAVSESSQTGSDSSVSSKESPPKNQPANEQTSSSGNEDIEVISDNEDWIISDVDWSQTDQEASTGKTIDPQSVRHTQGTGSYTLIEYSDTECPYSKEYHTILDEVFPNYENEIQRGYKHFALNQHLEKATLQAEATECAADQDKFWEYTAEIYKRTHSNNSLPDAELFVIAQDLKLDEDAFNDCLAQATYNSLVKDNSKEAQELGATGTPFSIYVDADGNVVKILKGKYSASELEDLFNQYLK